MCVDIDLFVDVLLVVMFDTQPPYIVRPIVVIMVSLSKFFATFNLALLGFWKGLSGPSADPTLFSFLGI